jgi:Ca2+-binding RTX toxin-like protein
MIRHVETLSLTGHSDITFANGNVDRGATITVTLGDGSFVDASAETNGHYVVNGSPSADILIGGRGADTLSGAAGDDQLNGLRGADILTGGDGADTFGFENVAESTNKARDLIIDFDAATDRIELSEIDARTDKAGDQAFRLVDHFTHAAGQLTLTYDAEDNVTHVKGDVDGDGKADLFFDVSGELTDVTGFLL